MFDKIDYSFQIGMILLFMGFASILDYMDSCNTMNDAGEPVV